MSAKSTENLRRSFTNGLCTRCGTCAGLSDGAVVFKDIEGKYLPYLKGSISGSMADRIWAGCSAREIPFGELNRFLFGDEALKSGFFGCYKEIGIAFASDLFVGGTVRAAGFYPRYCYGSWRRNLSGEL